MNYLKFLANVQTINETKKKKKKTLNTFHII